MSKFLYLMTILVATTVLAQWVDMALDGYKEDMIIHTAVLLLMADRIFKGRGQ